MFNELEHSHSNDQMEDLNSSSQIQEKSSSDSATDLDLGSENKRSLTVVKIGGSTLGSHDTTLTDLVELQSKGKQFVVVHGGGKTLVQVKDVTVEILPPTPKAPTWEKVGRPKGNKKNSEAKASAVVKAEGK